MRRKGQQTGSAAGIVVGLIGLLIVFYILFLPPDDRARLLGEPVGGTGGTGTPGGTAPVEYDTSEPIFLVSPGRIDYSALDEYHYDLPSFTIKKTIQSAVLDSTGNFYVRNGWFDKQEKNLSFTISSLETTSNVMMSVSMAKKQGRLIIELNGHEIYNFEPRQLNIEPVTLPASALNQGDNHLRFRVSDVGMNFWTTNEYLIENFKITADLTDTSRQESRNYFHVSEDEGKNIQSARLRFNPDCRVSEVGFLDVYFNNVQVFSGIPDCGITNSYTLSPSLINTGRNVVNFRTTEGAYLIDQISVITKLKEPTHPTYYFDLDDVLFETTRDYKVRCGDNDGICPSDCDESLDIDCCFSKYNKAYWCDVPTAILGDRCVGYVSQNMCERCPSGYEDSAGRPPDVCKGLCGDDTDRKCPEGCPSHHDKDCCYALPGDQYWCNDLPINGVSFTCVNEVTQNNCRNCPTGYKGERSDPPCDDIFAGEKSTKLRSQFNILLEFAFTERGNEKEAIIWVNNHQTGFDTRESRWIKNIDAYVEPHTNSIKIMPRSNLEIREIKVYFGD